MNEQITDADIQTLQASNPLAAEQLRRIMAERQRDELKAELAASKGEQPEAEISNNGTLKDEAVLVER